MQSYFLLHTWLAVTDAANYETSLAFMVGLCCQLSPPLYALFFMSHILSVAKVPCRSLLFHVNLISSKSHTGYCEDVWKWLIQFACFCGK